MKKKPFRDDEGNWDSNAILVTLVGSYILWKVVSGSAAMSPLRVASVAWLPIGIAMGFQWRPAYLAGAILALVLAWFTGLDAVRSFSWLAPLSLAFLLYICWSFWQYWRALGEEQESGEDEEDSDRPLISLVLLLKSPRYMETQILSPILESAWGGDYSTEGEGAGKSGFVVGEKPIFMVKTPMGMFVMHFRDVPYWEDMDKLLEAVPELRLRHAIAQHTAWLAVDFLSPESEEVSPEVVFPAIARLIYELADEETLAVVRPDTRQINVWTDGVMELILQPRGAEIFNQRLSDPVLQVRADDEAMKAAVDEARRRWPEFVAAFKERNQEGDGMYIVKAPITVDDNTEYIWLEVTGLEPDYIHGKLANEPVALGDLAIGSMVEVPVSDLNDWAFSAGQDSPPVGMFTNEVIARAQRRRGESGKDKE
jgi:uncharacterized protein YegJ (DUF2314 family)